MKTPKTVKWLTSKEAQERYKLTQPQISALVKDGTLEVKRGGTTLRRYVISVASLEAHKEKMAIPFHERLKQS